ncbi:hypothetical protein [Couchioplanes azureus]|uniref:hypothetical protein n=1 Tax=Couchioplanes caeruleus TaxID=56438 RepID=UPI001670C442|nr:hypothetical protein [Couchioplanes caeruleus]GGQ40025.1 hypothetical protein GCM10010166_03700 [Couchioplanes caeruleus subsp. azureus]
MHDSSGSITQSALVDSFLIALWAAGTIVPVLLGASLWRRGRRATSAVALAWTCVFVGAGPLVFGPTSVDVPARLSGPDEYSTGNAAEWARSDGRFSTIGAGKVQCFAGASAGTVAFLERSARDAFYGHPEFVWTDQKCRSTARVRLPAAAGVVLADLVAIALLVRILRRSGSRRPPCGHRLPHPGSQGDFAGGAGPD